VPISEKFALFGKNIAMGIRLQQGEVIYDRRWLLPLEGLAARGFLNLHSQTFSTPASIRVRQRADIAHQERPVSCAVPLPMRR
jgi:hypothetical protein